MSEIPPTGVPSEVPPAPPTRRLLGKKLFLVIGLIAIIAVTSVFAAMYLMPKGLGAKVSLGINYSVGEKMTYDFTVTMGVMGQTVMQQGIMSLEILSFDGENYTLRYTTQLGSQVFSYTARMNKTGHICDITGLPPELQQTYSSLFGMPGFGSYFPKTEARVGESWQIPLNIQTSNLSLNGTVQYGISGVANVTTPAGTYSIFRLDIAANNVHGTGISSGTTVNMVLSISAYAYFENATCLPVEMSIQGSATASASGQTMSISMAIQIRLKEHTK